MWSPNPTRPAFLRVRPKYADTPEGRARRQPSTSPTPTLIEKLKLLRLANRARREINDRNENDNMDTISKLKSRKLWITVGTAALLALGQQLGMSDQTMQAIMAIVSSYLLGQGWADGKTSEARGVYEGKRADADATVARAEIAATAVVRTAEVEARAGVEMAQANALAMAPPPPDYHTFGTPGTLNNPKAGQSPTIASLALGLLLVGASSGMTGCASLGSMGGFGDALGDIQGKYEVRVGTVRTTEPDGTPAMAGPFIVRERALEPQPPLGVGK